MLWSAVILGVLGSFHCVGMCGPIAFMLPVDRTNSTKKVFQIFTYHLGRILAYSIIGLIFGLVGKSLYIFGLQQQLSIAIGILMIAVILMPAHIFNKYNFSKPIYRLISKVKTAMGQAFKKKTADTFLTIPMVGFTESLNISVSVAIILQQLTERLRHSDISWQLSEEEKEEICIDWALKSIRSPKDVLKRYQELQKQNL